MLRVEVSMVCGIMRQGASLSRQKGVWTQYSDLLQAVDTVHTGWLLSATQFSLHMSDYKKLR